MTLADLFAMSQEQAPRKKAAIDLTQTSVGGGRVGKLHDIVSFDENDHDDDADIDLDEDISGYTRVRAR